MEVIALLFVVFIAVKVIPAFFGLVLLALFTSDSGVDR